MKKEEKMKKWKTAIQMYTLREALEQDFKGVCRELVKLGCDGAEFVAIFGGMAPDELAAFLKEIGLKACGLHLSCEDLTSNKIPRSFEYAKALDIHYLTFSYGGDFTKVTPEVTALCAKAGGTAARNGFQFTYHNHAAEFADFEGMHALDYIYSHTDPHQVMAELDVYWIAKGGEDPVKYIRKYASRLPQLHLKDMDREDGSFTELGNGCIDLEACVKAAEETNCQWLIYEQDICKRPVFESAAISLAYLNKILNR